MFNVEGILFLCTRDGVEAAGVFQDGTLCDNTFWAGNNGLSLGGDSSTRLIQDNFVKAEGDGLRIGGADDVKISGNYISGNSGLVLMVCYHFQIHKNTIQAKYQGVLIANESWKNQIREKNIL